jgi:hypothetical protein
MSAHGVDRSRYVVRAFRFEMRSHTSSLMEGHPAPATEGGPMVQPANEATPGSECSLRWTRLRLTIGRSGRSSAGNRVFAGGASARTASLPASWISHRQQVSKTHRTASSNSSDLVVFALDLDQLDVVNGYQKRSAAMAVATPLHKFRTSTCNSISARCSPVTLVFAYPTSTMIIGFRKPPRRNVHSACSVREQGEVK